ncbi:MAG: flippase-like domain-containing protein [Magnetococcales bacterium]|nr:flippase-like domain-containing protein [Magnetococcales bacterium]
MNEDTPQPTVQPAKKTKTKLKILAFFILGLSILIFILQNLGITPAIARDALINVGYFYSALILATYFVLVFLVAIKWKVIIMSLAENISPRRGYFMYYASLSFLINGFIPQGGFGVRVGSLKVLYDVPVSKGIISQFIDQLFELIVTAILIPPSILYMLHILSMGEALLLLLFSIIMVYLLIHYSNPERIQLVGHWLKSRTSSLERFALFSKFSRMLVDIPFEKLNLKWIVSISFIRMSVSIASTLCMMWAAGISITYLELLLVAPVVYLIGLFSFTPQGIGTVDAGWLGVLLALGVDKLTIGKFLIIELAWGNLSQAIVTIVLYLFYTAFNWLQAGKNSSISCAPSESILIRGENRIPTSIGRKK